MACKLPEESLGRLCVHSFVVTASFAHIGNESFSSFVIPTIPWQGQCVLYQFPLQYKQQNHYPNERSLVLRIMTRITNHYFYWVLLRCTLLNHFASTKFILLLLRLAPFCALGGDQSWRSNHIKLIFGFLSEFMKKGNSERNPEKGFMCFDRQWILLRLTSLRARQRVPTSTELSQPRHKRQSGFRKPRHVHVLTPCLN